MSLMSQLKWSYESGKKWHRWVWLQNKYFCSISWLAIICTLRFVAQIVIGRSVIAQRSSSLLRLLLCYSRCFYFLKLMDPPQVVAVLGLEPDLMTPCYHHSTGIFLLVLCTYLYFSAICTTSSPSIFLLFPLVLPVSSHYFYYCSDSSYSWQHTRCLARILATPDEEISQDSNGCHLLRI